MTTEQDLQIKLARTKATIKKTLRLLNVKNRLRLLQNQYDSKVIKTLRKKDKELYQDIIEELKPDYDKMQANKKKIFDEIDRMKKTGRWIKTKKRIGLK